MPTTKKAMTKLPSDAMAAVHRLRENGLDERQAEAITEIVRDGMTGGVATRGDLAGLEIELKWIKLIGEAILAVLTVPRLAELRSGTIPGVTG